MLACGLLQSRSNFNSSLTKNTVANRRMLSKSVSTSRKLMKISDFAALLWTWTVPHCDDLGHMDGSPEMIKGIVVPLRNKTLDEIATALSELETAELIKLYDFEGDKYLEIVKWEDYQTFKNDRDLQQDFPLAPWNPKVSKRNPDGKIVRLSKSNISKENIREDKGSEKQKFGEFQKVLLDSEEFRKLNEKIGENNALLLIDELDNYIASKGKKYSSHYATLLSWARRKYSEQKEKLSAKTKVIR